jgi:hypothetical protein
MAKEKEGINTVIRAYLWAWVVIVVYTFLLLSGKEISQTFEFLFVFVIARMIAWEKAIEFFSKKK